MKFWPKKRTFSILALLFALSFTTVSTSSCARKIGCEAEHNVGPKTDRYGNLKMKKGKSQLFSKKQNKNRRKRR
jgi:hypothetical protein